MPRSLVKHDFWVCLCEGVFRTLAFESVEGETSLTNMGGHHPLMQGPNRTKGGRRVSSLCLSSWAGMSIFPCPQMSKLLVLGSLDSKSYTSNLPTPHTIPVLRPSEKATDLYHWFSRLSCWQIVDCGTSGLHNRASQFLL